MMEKITVFTPTFNRAFCLGRVYDSMKRQTRRDFVWMIIDDGSSDGTRELVESWQREGLVSIEYIYQENLGMHGAHNTAYANIKTELNTCIDSDDFMPDNAIENILRNWEQVRAPHLAGIIGLDAYQSDGTVVGTQFPSHITESTLQDLHRIHKVTGDKKLVLRTDVVREFPPYPIYPEEKFVPLGTLYLMIDQKYKLRCVNEVYCVVEYLAEGSSRNIFRQYKRSARGFRYARTLEMKYSRSFSYTFTRAMHLVSSSFFTGESIFKDNPKKAITLLALPAGIFLHYYIL